MISSSQMGTIDDGMNDDYDGVAIDNGMNDGDDGVADVYVAVDRDGASMDDVSNINDVLLHDVSADNFNVSNEYALLHDVSNGNSVASDEAEDVQKFHSQPERRTRKSEKHRTHLVRSKSDGIIMQGALGQQRTPSELRPVPLLKKAGTFESTWRRRLVKPVVVVADPPEEGLVGEEEVDRKAEEFIGRFYQRMKLQR
ncbi:hypothetical protein GOP47_0029230 [Adiantum capillus-veneris]|nr:hypothetical protein GOP47_0029230 [Adiantum capillus-veneris]